MKIPAIRGVIDRRILVNYRVDPAALTKVLTGPFRPKLVDGWGMAGICLIRLKEIRPRFLPAALGLSSENAAHRIAVEWDEGGSRREGVFVPRRDTSSRLNTAVGGVLFPGVQHHATFRIDEQDDRFGVEMESDDHTTRVAVEGRLSHALPAASVFGSLPEASDFFERGALGYSLTARPNELDGLELQSFGWNVEPLDVGRVESSFFDDRALFPVGSIEFDCALLMRGIVHEWHGRGSLRTGPQGVGCRDTEPGQV